MADRVEILRRYANGAELRGISAELGVDHEEVVEVVSELGFQRGRASEELKKLARDGQPVAPAAGPKPAKVVVTPAPKPPVPTGVQALVDAEAAGGRFAARAAKIREQMAELGRDLLGDAEVIAAEKRVERLRAQLAEAAEHLKKLKPPARSRPVDYDARVVRAWAKDNDVACPAAGRFLPPDVVDAWREATRG